MSESEMELNNDVALWIEPVELSEIEREALARREGASVVKFSKDAVQS